MVRLDISDIEDIITCNKCGVLFKFDKDKIIKPKNDCSYIECPVCKEHNTAWRYNDD